MDFNPRQTLTEILSERIFDAWKARGDARPSRDYLGGSVVGYDCARQIQFMVYNTPPDQGRGFSGRTYSIFDRGHWVEDHMASMLREAGFDLATHDEANRQFEFTALDGKIRGHADGIISAGPAIADTGKFARVGYPCLWENKGLGRKYWNELDRKKLRNSYPNYFGQVQLYMAYFNLTENPCLFTAVNMDTMDIYAEAVPFDQQAAQSLSDRALDIVQACEAGQPLPRVSSSRDYYACRMCNWQDRCWSMEQ